MEEGDSATRIKERLAAATGVPAKDMKLRMGGYNQMVMIDTASNIRVGTCGVTQGERCARGGARRCAQHLRPPEASRRARRAAVQEYDNGAPTPESFK